MPTPKPIRVALCRDLDAIAIDPATGREICMHELPAGTMVLDPLAALQRAADSGTGEVLLRVEPRGDWPGCELVTAAALRAALPAECFAPAVAHRWHA
jgi:hypothetical protein